MAMLLNDIFHFIFYRSFGSPGDAHTDFLVLALLVACDLLLNYALKYYLYRNISFYLLGLANHVILL